MFEWVGKEPSSEVSFFPLKVCDVVCVGDVSVDLSSDGFMRGGYNLLVEGENM